MAAFADNPELDDHARVDAAAALAEVDGYREAGVERLTALADNPELDDDIRVDAAACLDRKNNRQ
ncbi:hypothetical protein HUT16_17725 [Kitasatospora sp. NA04385]|uniref:hypothetical protein n=1 Tax=Kitasatospora sp. NA04385 TaxID=2742135 RepID=UPI001590C083|nr:hypothetical protein [Kitasatospora sp. NA04385]QKW20663.1 hypothetical protein HUT16_17725 [Kitasatospora sp. NA04385]